MKTEVDSVVESGQQNEKGVPESGYGISKIGMSMFARIFGNFVFWRGLLYAKKINKHMTLKARENKDKLWVAAMCPGHCNTDMSNHKGNRSPSDGASVATYLATQDLTKLGETGKFWEMKDGATPHVSAYI